jgi:site-specific DNA-methyltransferase (adenine-specific)/modification methylase
MIEPVILGDCTLYLGDCLEVMKQLPDKSVDAVIDRRLQIITACDTIGCEGEHNHEGSTSGEQTQTTGSGNYMGGAQAGNRMAVLQTGMVTEEDSQILRDFPVGTFQDHEAFEHSGEGQRQSWQEERQIQGRIEKHALSPNDSQRQMLELWSNREASYSPQEREPSGQSFRKSTSPLREMPQQINKNAVVAKSKIIIITDPPYGINHPTDYNNRGRSNLAQCNDYEKVINDDKPFDPSPFLSYPCCFWGANYFADKLPISSGWLVWDKLRPDDLDQATCELAWTNFVKGVRRFQYRWNGMIRDGNEELFHPTQKPIALMKWILSLQWTPKGAIFDPYMGSGTTGVACVQLGRKFIGCEIEPKYFDIAVKRIKEAQLQMRLEI